MSTIITITDIPVVNCDSEHMKITVLKCVEEEKRADIGQPNSVNLSDACLTQWEAAYIDPEFKKAISEKSP